ncbi:hypothetical protein C8J43_101996 [Sphingomonas sp. PP-CE-1G-424]|nr:hypothetical protein C8J43_101996 [Sphingomonas sp. PP-CE-1G-424]
MQDSVRETAGTGHRFEPLPKSNWPIRVFVEAKSGAIMRGELTLH